MILSRARKIVRRLGPLASITFLIIAAAQSRPFLTPFLRPILAMIAKMSNGRIYYSYELNGVRLRGFLRYEQLWSDFQSALELAVGDCYELGKVAEPSLIIDGGANIGLFSLAALARWPNARIVAFEPLHENVLAIQSHLILNNLSERVDLREVALSSKYGTATFYVRDANQGSFFSNVPASGCIEVNTVPITEFISVKRKEKILIKLDVEGAEVEIMRQLVAGLESIENIEVVMELHDTGKNRPLMEEIARSVNGKLEYFEVGSQTAHCRFFSRQMN